MPLQVFPRLTKSGNNSKEPASSYISHSTRDVEYEIKGPVRLNLFESSTVLIKSKRNRPYNKPPVYLQLLGAEMDDKVALILGYGPHVGFAVAESLAMSGYKVAVVSRSDKYPDTAKNYLQIQADLSIPSSVEGIFTRVIEELGHPTVVVYNGKVSLRYWPVSV